MRKKEKIKNRVSALLLSGVIVSGLMAPTFSFDARAEALPDIYNASVTIADIVMSTYTASGVLVANVDWVDDLYNAFGSSFGTIQDFVDNGKIILDTAGNWIDNGLGVTIEATQAYSDLCLDSVLSVSAEEAQNIGASGALAGSTTIASAVCGCAKYGVIGLGVGVVGYCGFEIGTILAHMMGLYGEDIEKANPITAEEALKNLPVTSGYFLIDDSRFSPNLRYVNNSKCCVCYYDNGNNYTYWTIFKTNKNLNDIIVNYLVTFSNNSTSTNNQRADAYGCCENTFSYSKNYGVVVQNAIKVSSSDDLETYRENAHNNVFPQKYSPDLVGSDSNLYNENGLIKGLRDKINPNTQSVDPSKANEDLWKDLARRVRANNDNNNYPDNGDVYNEITDVIYLPTPTPAPSPDPDPNPDPDPDPDPNPDPETYPVPGPVPDPSPVPDPDYQPETKPQPDFTEKQTENETDITEGDPWTTPDLLEKFPFCIPKDIYRVFTKLDSKARSAPHIQWRFHPNSMIDHTFDIDFSQWDSIATLLRTLELLAFIVGLAIGTRKLIIGG